MFHYCPSYSWGGRDLERINDILQQDLNPYHSKFKQHAFFFPPLLLWGRGLVPPFSLSSQHDSNWILPFHSVDKFKITYNFYFRKTTKVRAVFWAQITAKIFPLWSLPEGSEIPWDCQRTEDFSFLPKWQKPSRASQIYPKDFQADSVVVRFCIFPHLHQVLQVWVQLEKKKRDKQACDIQQRTVWSHSPKRPVRANPISARSRPS